MKAMDLIQIIMDNKIDDLEIEIELDGKLYEIEGVKQCVEVSISRTDKIIRSTTLRLLADNNRR